MDRFIDYPKRDWLQYTLYLKSNMDRFIELRQRAERILKKHLKSNMDRFIDLAIWSGARCLLI